MAQSRAFKAGILSFGKFLATLTTILTIAVLSRILTKVEYAAYRQTLLAFHFVAPFLALGLPKALYFFFPRNKYKNKKILTNNLLLLFSMGIIFMIAMWMGGNKLLALRFSNPSLSKLLIIFSPYALFALPIQSIDACLVSNNRVKLLTIYNIISKIVLFLLVITFVLLWDTSSAAIVGNLLATFLIFMPAIYLMYKTTEGTEWLPDKDNIIEQLKYSVPLGVATLIGTMVKNLDKILVSSLSSPEEFAVYVNGAWEIPLIAVITGSIISVLIPEFSEMYRTGNLKRILAVWHSAMLKSALIIFPLMIFLFIVAPTLMRFVFSEEYENSSLPFRVYLLALPIRITQFGAIFMAAGKNKLILYRSFVSLVINFGLSLLLMKIIGNIGAAIATVLVLYCWAVTHSLYYIKKILKVEANKLLPLKKLGQIMAISICTGFIFFLIPLYRSWGDTISLFISGILYGGLVILTFNFFKFVDINMLAKKATEQIFR
jgi:O-antigen/teichoic acid export membrane protein